MALFKTVCKNKIKTDLKKDMITQKTLEWTNIKGLQPLFNSYQ